MIDIKNFIQKNKAGVKILGVLKRAHKPRKPQIYLEKTKETFPIVEQYIGAQAFVEWSADFFHSSQSS